jgi:hypothetical protein
LSFGSIGLEAFRRNEIGLHRIARAAADVASADTHHAHQTAGGQVYLLSPKEFVQNDARATQDDAAAGLGAVSVALKGSRSAASVVVVSSRGWMLFAAMSIIWGIPYLFIKIGVEGVSVPVLVLARTGVGAAVLLPFALSRDSRAAIRRHWKPLLAFAVASHDGRVPRIRRADICRSGGADMAA